MHQFEQKFTYKLVVNEYVRESATVATVVPGTIYDENYPLTVEYTRTHLSKQKVFNLPTSDTRTAARLLLKLDCEFDNATLYCCTHHVSKPIKTFRDCYQHRNRHYLNAA